MNPGILGGKGQGMTSFRRGDKQCCRPAGRNRVWMLSAPLLPALLILLSACGHVVGVMQPVGTTVAGASKVDMLVLTTRRPSGNPATLYGGARAQSFSLNDITISIPPDANRKAGDVQWPSHLPPDPSREFTTLAVRPLPPTQAAGSAWLAKNLPKSRDVLVFVHGFNNRYEDAVYRFAQIMHDSHADAAPVLFTWPSGGRLYDYNYDRESTIYSRDGLEQTLHILARDPRIHEVSILAHSMGTWLAMEALRQMAIREGRVEPKIKNVILASPDIDIDVFAKQWSDLGAHRPAFTVFVSRDDRALAISRLIAGNVNRLGQINPNVEPYRSAAEKAGITFIDLTDLKTTDSGMNHGKFAASPEIVKAIGTRLVAGQTLTQSEIGLGDAVSILTAGTAKAVGTGVGLAVSAPLAVVDPNTRANLTGQADSLAQQVSDPTGVSNDARSTAGEELMTDDPRQKKPAGQ